MRVDGNSGKRARRLRKQMTLPEVVLWTALRGRAEGRPAFRRQHPIGPYVLDFYCARARLTVEVDGEGHGFGDRPMRDARKDAYLREQGIHVVRVSAKGVLADATMIGNSLIQLACDRSAPSTTFVVPLPRSSLRGRN